MPIGLSLFGREKRTKNLKKTTVNQRIIIKELFYSSNAISVYQLSKNTNIVTSVIRDIIDTFTKSSFVTSITTAQYKSQRNSGYKLTKNGFVAAIAVLVDEGISLGEKKKDYLLEIFQSEKGNDAFAIFGCNFMINAINKKELEDYVLNFIKKTYEYRETTGKLNMWSFPEGLIESTVLESKPIKECVSNALGTLTDSEKQMAVEYVRNKTIGMMYDFGIHSHNIQIQKIATMSSRDPDGLYLPINCKCRYSNMSAYFNMEALLAKLFIGGLTCPKCGRIVKNNKKNQNQLRITNPKLYSR